LPPPLHVHYTPRSKSRQLDCFGLGRYVYSMSAALAMTILSRHCEGSRVLCRRSAAARSNPATDSRVGLPPPLHVRYTARSKSRQLDCFGLVRSVCAMSIALAMTILSRHCEGSRVLCRRSVAARSNPVTLVRGRRWSGGGQAAGASPHPT